MSSSEIWMVFKEVDLFSFSQQLLDSEKLSELKFAAVLHWRLCLPKRPQDAERIAICPQPPHVSAIGYANMFPVHTSNSVS